MSAFTNDFDFLNGSWDINNRYLKARLKRSTEWIEFQAHSEVQPLLGGAGQIEKFFANRDGRQVLGTTLRLLNPNTGEWSLYWADNIRPGLQPPMIGKFNGDTGDFFGGEEVDGRKVLCRFRWTKGESPRWEQSFSTDAGQSWELNWVMTFTRPKAANNFPVIEFRRYTIEATERARFAQYFDAYFPEATQQLNAILFGQFLDHDDPSGFTWIRGFRSMDERATVNTAIYNGPLWREHSATMNQHMLDYTNVLLLRPLYPESSLPVLPAVDPVAEPEGSKGMVVASIFAVKPGQADHFGKQVQAAFADPSIDGMNEAGILETLDAPNNFPRLPYRTDGPYVVYFSVIKDEATWTALKPRVARKIEALASSADLRSKPEILVLGPTRRSRLRWRSTPH